MTSAVVLILGHPGDTPAPETGGTAASLPVLAVAHKLQSTFSKCTDVNCFLDDNFTIGGAVTCQIAKTAIANCFRSHPNADYFVVAYLGHGKAGSGNPALASGSGFLRRFDNLSMADIYEAWQRSGKTGQRRNTARLCVFSLACYSGMWVKEAMEKGWELYIQASTPADGKQFQETVGTVFAEQWCEFVRDQSERSRRQIIKLLDEAQGWNAEKKQNELMRCMPSAYKPANWPDLSFFPLLAVGQKSSVPPKAPARLLPEALGEPFPADSRRLLQPVVERLKELGYLQGLCPFDDDFVNLLIEHTFFRMTAGDAEDILRMRLFALENAKYFATVREQDTKKIDPDVDAFAKIVQLRLHLGPMSSLRQMKEYFPLLQRRAQELSTCGSNLARCSICGREFVNWNVQDSLWMSRSHSEKLIKRPGATVLYRMTEGRPNFSAADGAGHSYTYGAIVATHRQSNDIYHYLIWQCAPGADGKLLEQFTDFFGKQRGGFDDFLRDPKFPVNPTGERYVDKADARVIRAGALSAKSGPESRSVADRADSKASVVDSGTGSSAGNSAGSTAGSRAGMGNAAQSGTFGYRNQSHVHPAPGSADEVD